MGLAKLAFALLIAACGAYVCARQVKRMAGFADLDSALTEGNVAVGISFAGTILAMGLLTQFALQNSFTVLALLSYGGGDWLDMAWVLAYAIGMVGVSLLVGALVISAGIALSVRLTPNIDEIAEIRRGNVACALVLATTVVVMAFLAREGLDTLLTGGMPLPPLGRDIS